MEVLTSIWKQLIVDILKIEYSRVKKNVENLVTKWQFRPLINLTGIKQTSFKIPSQGDLFWYLSVIRRVGTERLCNAAKIIVNNYLMNEVYQLWADNCLILQLSCDWHHNLSILVGVRAKLSAAPHLPFVFVFGKLLR